MTDSPGQRLGQYWVRWLGQNVREFELTPFRITVIYLFAGSVALYFSDALLVSYLSEPQLSQAQAIKGGVEVLVTGGFIYLFTSRSHGQLESTAMELERHREELRLLHRVFRHNLRNDLNLIMGTAKLAQEEIADERGSKRCEEIVDAAEEILQYTEQARQIRNVPQYDQYTTIDLAEVIPEILEAHPKVTEQVTVTTALPETAEVQVNPLFEEAVIELVTNAIEHNDTDSPTLTIEVDTSSGPSQTVTLSIRDDGPGISETEVDSIRADRESQLYHSTGMGLWFVDWVVTYSGGEVSIARTDMDGTEVRVRLPAELPSPLDFTLQRTAQ